MKRGIALTAVLTTAAIFVTVMITGWSVGRGAGIASAPSAQLASASTMPHLYLTFDTPHMLGGTEETGPALVPSSFTLPANTVVSVTVVNFDGATPLPAGSEKYATATGLVGALSIQPLDTVHPNAPATATSATSVDPITGISHTFTMPQLGINVPIAPTSRTTFTFRTGAAGTYQWRCMDPCGSGDSGWGGAMSADGFMQGKVTFA